MLQQTQVERVVPYFERFIARFATLDDLASASRAEVISLWSGLGYNRRAVYLHELARVVVERHNGELPSDPSALRALPGIGAYTVGAILSIGFGQDAPALDTNVRRVLARYGFGRAASEAELVKLAKRLVPPGRASRWNQALMDLGASLCTARAPRCLLCPLREGCRGVGQPSPPARRSPVGYAGSTRYYRGRLLAALRALEPGTQDPLAAVARRLEQQGVAEPKAGWEVVGQSLARDGLAAILNTREGPLIGLPD